MVPSKYANNYLPVKYFLASYRALSDGRSGIRHLEELLNEATGLLSEWKVNWIGTCALLRTAIALFKVDEKSCLPPRLRAELAAEWKSIKDQRADHEIYWEFLTRERNNILHEYDWQAYEAWMKPDGTLRAASLSLLSLLTLGEDGARPVLLIKGGPFEGRNSLDLLREGADWVEARIFAAVRRAGYDPEEERGLVHFQPRPKPSGGLLDLLVSGDDSQP